MCVERDGPHLRLWFGEHASLFIVRVGGKECMCVCVCVFYLLMLSVHVCVFLCIITPSVCEANAQVLTVVESGLCLWQRQCRACMFACMCWSVCW